MAGARRRRGGDVAWDCRSALRSRETGEVAVCRREKGLGWEGFFPCLYMWVVLMYYAGW